ncbi:ufm1-specific protease 2-like [Mustelus asterias]
MSNDPNATQVLILDSMYTGSDDLATVTDKDVAPIFSNVQQPHLTEAKVKKLNDNELPLVPDELLFRIKGGVLLEGVLNETDEEGIKAGFKEAINKLISKVNSQTFILNGLGSALYMWPKTHASTHSSKLQDDTRCRSILKYVAVEVSQFLKNASKTKSINIAPLKVINLQIMFEVKSPDFSKPGVIIQHNDMSRVHFKLTLPIDVVVFANPNEPWGKLQDLFVEAVTAQLSAMDKCIQRYTTGKTVPIPQAYHFELPKKTTLTTVIYPAGISDQTLEPQRKELHAEHGLGNKPFFRRPMTYCFPCDEKEPNRLKNVHKYIPAPDPDEFKVALVHGFYVFYHCLQHEEDDSDWGAPFRCLQVVISWFNFQGYINKPAPLLADELMAIKTAFIRVVLDKEWLDVEGMVALLNSYNISSTVIDDQCSVPALRPETVTSSFPITTLFPENNNNYRKQIKYFNSYRTKPADLSAHFEEQGTPVVIFKSVIFAEPKAYILLGMAVNEDLKAKKVLLLDTMYTGADDLVYIIDKMMENYAQVKKGLSTIFSVKKFTHFLYGKYFVLLANHRPLTIIFEPYTGIPSIAAARLQRWPLALSAYFYKIKYRQSKKYGNTDMLSRLPLPVEKDVPDWNLKIMYFSQEDKVLVSMIQGSNATQNDPVLSDGHSSEKKDQS